MKYFDSHCHINMDPLLKEQSNVFKELENLKFGVNIVGYDINSSLIAIEQAKRKNVYATIGVHPCDIDDDIENAKKQLEEMILKSNKIIAIGETGFDFYHIKETPELYIKQLEWLNMHHELAKENNFPLMMHVRDGKERMIEWIKKNHYHKIIIHCFGEDYSTAKNYIDLGCYLSIPGIITYKNAKILHESIKNISLEKIIVETDSPFLAPVPYRGKVNYPQYSLEVIKKIADLKALDFEYVSKIILENTKRIFNI